MQPFAALIDALIYTRSRNGKLKLIADYLVATPDPDRGWALAALTGGLDFPAVKSSTIRNLLMERVDPVLYVLSRDYVGDTAETASLLWPEPALAPGPAPSLSEAVASLQRMTRLSVVRELPALLDRLDANGRYALLKLATGAMRIGVSGRLAKTAFAMAFGVSVDDVEEYWHGQFAPYAPLFDWAARGAPPPTGEDLPLFRPFMLAHPLDDTIVDLRDYAAEWKWDGIRVQLVHVDTESAERRASTRGPATTSPARFPSSPPPCRSRRCSMANCWCAARTKAGRKAGRPASTRFSSGWGARPSRRRCLPTTRRSSGFTTFSSSKGKT